MSITEQLVMLADYNRLMNQRLYAAAAELSAADIYGDKGAFFKSVIGTLNHILAGDILWLKRFASHSSFSHALAYVSELDGPGSLDEILFNELGRLHTERKRVDGLIVTWIGSLSDDEIGACISYTNMAGVTYSKPFLGLITHLFLHQVHHRGQVTTLLSQCGVDFGETDVVEIIRECGV